MTDTPILARPEGPSRYLYLASAGTSLLLAWGLEEGSRRLLSWGKYVYGVLLAGILVSSYYYLKEAEAMAFYTSGRHYITRGDLETGVEQLKRAIDQVGDAIDLEDAYERICFVGMGREGTEGILDEALAAFPTSPQLTIYKLAFDSLKPDSVLSRGARDQLEAFKAGESRVSIRAGWRSPIVLTDQENIQAARRDIASLYHNTGINLAAGMTLDDLERAIPVLRLSLEFDSERTATSQGLVSALISAGRETEALQAALEAVERNPQAPIGLQVAASFALMASGRAEEGTALSHQALKGDDVTEAQRETVLQVYGDLLKGAYGEVSSSACVRMGRDLLDGGRTEEADEAFRQALEKDPHNRRAHFGLGLALLSQGQVAKAEKLYAEGVARFGLTAALESGAAEGLRSLVAQGIQVEAARKILATHLPEL